MTVSTPSHAVSAVVPNYNGQHLLAKHLPAVITALEDGDELLVIDDCSTDDSVRWLTQLYKLELDPVLSTEVARVFTHPKLKFKGKKIDFKLIVNQSNLRFGATANRGVAGAQHNLVFLINNDVSPQAQVLSYLVPAFSDETVFAVGCLEKERTADGIQLGGKNRLWFERGIFMHSRATNFKSGRTSWVSGGSGMFDRTKWLELGGFERAYYPAYWEDVDLSFRARKKGWKVLFEAKAVVNHNHESTHTDVFGQQKIMDIGWKNALIFTLRNADPAQRLQFWLWQPYWWWARRQASKQLKKRKS
jgi:GT2 family glycosyltransferase